MKEEWRSCQSINTTNLQDNSLTSSYKIVTLLEASSQSHTVYFPRTHTKKHLFFFNILLFNVAFNWVFSLYLLCLGQFLWMSKHCTTVALSAVLSKVCWWVGMSPGRSQQGGGSRQKVFVAVYLLPHFYFAQKWYFVCQSVLWNVSLFLIKLNTLFLFYHKRSSSFTDWWERNRKKPELVFGTIIHKFTWFAHDSVLCAAAFQERQRGRQLLIFSCPEARPRAASFDPLSPRLWMFVAMDEKYRHSGEFPICST